VARLQAGYSGIHIPAGTRDFSLLPERPDWLQGLPRLLFEGSTFPRDNVTIA